MHDMSYNFDEESSLDVSSPRCLNSPSVSIFISLHFLVTYNYQLIVVFYLIKFFISHSEQ